METERSELRLVVWSYLWVKKYCLWETRLQNANAKKSSLFLIFSLPSTDCNYKCFYKTATRIQNIVTEILLKYNFDIYISFLFADQCSVNWEPSAERTGPAYLGIILLKLPGTNDFDIIGSVTYLRASVGRSVSRSVKIS